MDEAPVLAQVHGRVALITLNRPKQLNALNDALMNLLGEKLLSFDADENISVIVLTGNEKAFAAGADINVMAQFSFVDCYKNEFITRNWETLTRIRKPVIAAVAGYALGGGCELAMMCDTVIAAENAKFGQPEINLGVIPGAGGTQRLTRAVGKAKAMDLVLSARMMDVNEAERAGLVSRIVATDQLVDKALEMANAIAKQSLPAILAAKECVNRAFESGLSDGIAFERRLFHALFATEDQKEGMQAFLQKRAPQFKNR